MAIAFRSKSEAYGTLSPLSVTKPSGTVADDVLIASRMYYHESGVDSAVSGWTLIDFASESTPETNDGHRLLMYYKVAGGSEPSSYSFPMAGDQVQSVAIACYSGVDTSAPINVYNLQYNGTSTSMTSAAITTTVANAMLVFAGCAGLSTGFSATPPSGFTERVDYYADWRCQYMAEKSQASAGSSGSATATMSVSRINWGALVALKPALPPNAPTLNSANPGNTQVALAWSAPGSGPTPTGYKVRRGTSPGTYGTTIDVGNVTSYTNTGLTNGTTYYFDIVAYNAIGDGGDSGELSATPSAGSPPNAPTIVSATAGNAQVALTWTAPGSGTAPTGYKVRRGTVSGTYGTIIDVGNVTSYTNTGLTNGTTYYFDILAYSGAGDGGDSSELSATPTASPTPPAPILASLVPATTQLTASWGSVAGATGYKVRIGTSSGSYGAATSVGNVTSYTFTGLTNGTTYYVIVIATNTYGDSGNSNELSGVPTTTSRIQTKYNDMAVGDIVFLEKLFTFEAMSVLQHPAPDSGKVYKSVTANGQAGYEFQVTRNLDGTGKNDWLSGDSYVNTGAPGSGFIDQYSYSSALSRPLEFITLDGVLADSFAVDYPLLTGAGSIAAFGVSNTKWDGLFLTLTTPAAYTSAAIVYEYWNGSAWTTLSGTVSVYNSSNATVTADWRTAGSMSVIFTAPADWATTTIATKTAYWIRVRVSAASGWTQNPKQGGGKWATRGKRQYGPTIAMWRRMSTTWNDLRETTVIGNLEGFYDYGTRAMGAAFGDPTANWIAIDAINGIRIMRGSVNLGQWDTSGNLQLGQVAASKANIRFDAATGDLLFRTNTTAYITIKGDGRMVLAQGAAAGNSINWETAGGGLISQIYGWTGTALGIERNWASLVAYGTGAKHSIVELVAYTSNNASGFTRLWLDATYARIVADNSFVANAGITTAGLASSGGVSASGDVTAGGAVYASNWLRATGGTGFYIEPFGPSSAYGAGGWYMTDATWMRSYNGKSIYTATNIQADGRIAAGSGISSCYNMTAQVIASATAYGAFLVPAERDVTIKQWTMNVYIQTTNNGSNYWQFELRRLSDTALISTWNTATWAANTWGRIGVALSSAITAASHMGVYIDVVKVGSPGAVQCASMLYMQ